ncbi:hypothetical protein HDU96_005652 [Phlyctochytrium bullatum]|nr:hypothetical protein HDU96_005652 [Phlyctochytrium bullatum]
MAGAILLAVCAAALALPAELTGLNENVYAPADCDSFSSVALTRCAAAVGQEAETCFERAMHSRRQCRDDLASVSADGPAKFRFEFAPDTTSPSLAEAMERFKALDGELEYDDTAAIENRKGGAISATPLEEKKSTHSNIPPMSRALVVKIGAILLAMSAAVRALPAGLNRLEENVYAPSDCDSFGSIAVTRCTAVVGPEGEACYDLAMQSRRQCREDLANSKTAKFRFEFAPGSATPSSDDATEPSEASDDDDDNNGAIQQRVLKIDRNNPFGASVIAKRHCPPKKDGRRCCNVDVEKKECGQIKDIPDNKKKQCEAQLDEAARYCRFWYSWLGGGSLDTTFYYVPIYKPPTPSPKP